MKKLRRCVACLKYTLDQSHCGKATKYGHPPPFSMLDKWAAFRRKLSLERATNV